MTSLYYEWVVNDYSKLWMDDEWIVYGFMGDERAIYTMNGWWMTSLYYEWVMDE